MAISLNVWPISSTQIAIFSWWSLILFSLSIIKFNYYFFQNYYIFEVYSATGWLNFWVSLKSFRVLYRLLFIWMYVNLYLGHFNTLNTFNTFLFVHQFFFSFARYFLFSLYLQLLWSDLWKIVNSILPFSWTNNHMYRVILVLHNRAVKNQKSSTDKYKKKIESPLHIFEMFLTLNSCSQWWNVK